MGQFYMSLETGHTTASVALKRLAAFSPKNRFYKANRKLGRVFKTEFILHYMTQPQLRTRIRRGLLKIEQLHALARDVYYGRRVILHGNRFLPKPAVLWFPVPAIASRGWSKPKRRGRECCYGDFSRTPTPDRNFHCASVCRGNLPEHWRVLA